MSKRSRKTKGDAIVEESPSSSGSSGKNKKKLKRSASPSSTAELYDSTTGRIDARIVTKNATAVTAAQSERFEELDENMSRDQLQARYEELRGIRATGPEKLLKDAIIAHRKETEAQQSLMETYKRRAAEVQAQLDMVEQEKQAAIKEEVEIRVAEATEAAEASAEDMIASLQAAFKQERATLIAAAKAGGSGSVASDGKDNVDKVEQGYYKSVALAYEELTGLRIVMENWEDGSMGGLQCTATNKETKQVVQFNLELDDDVEEGEVPEWDYTPGANVELLPEYLHEEISFPTTKGPKFVTRLVDALHSTQ